VYDTRTTHAKHMHSRLISVAKQIEHQIRAAGGTSTAIFRHTDMSECLSMVN
jgi:hypothetical protein